MCLHDSHDPYFWIEENKGVKHRLLREGTHRLEGCYQNCNGAYLEIIKM